MAAPIIYCFLASVNTTLDSFAQEIEAAERRKFYTDFNFSSNFYFWQHRFCELGVNFIKLWQNVNGEMHKVAQFFANFKENATYIANIFHAKKYGDIGFKNKQLICLSHWKMLMKSTPWMIR